MRVSSGLCQILRQAAQPAGVREGTVPYLAWVQAPREEERSDSYDASAFLAIGWGAALDIVRLSCDNQGQIIFMLVVRFQSGWHLSGLSFLSNDSLLVIDTKKQMRVLGFRPQHRVESRRLVPIENELSRGSGDHHDASWPGFRDS